MEQLFAPFEKDSLKFADCLITEFGSLEAARYAPREAVEIATNDLVCEVLSAFNAGIAYCLRQDIEHHPLRADDEKLYSYLVGTMGHCPWPQMSVLYLDANGYLLRDDVAAGSASDLETLSCRDVISRALRHGATALLVARNRPDGAAEPARAEVAFAVRLERIAKDLGIEVHDQLVVTGSKCISLREQGLFDAPPPDDMLDEEMEHALDIVLKRLNGKRASLLACERDRLVALAKDLYKSRRARDRYFGDMIDLGEPSWDLLIDLYIAGEGGKPISVSSACVAASVPTTTAMRRIEKLEKNGILERQPDPNDGRRSNLVLASEVKAAMEEYLLSLPLR